MKKVLATLLLALVGTTMMAQSKFNVSGVVMDKETSEPAQAASVRILSLPDSAMVAGAATGTYGQFALNGVKKGTYVLKVTYVGYNDYVAPLDLTNRKDRDVKLGNIALVPDTKVLKEAKVTANAARVQVNGDSLIYNAAAYHVAEGAVLEDLVKLLPGAKVDDGKVTINGKSVSKVLVGGKEFFLNDMDAAMKNLPTEMIDKIKTYDRKSDLSRITGIDDGEDETVIDLTVKKGMAEGWMGNVNAGAGTQHRYTSRLYAQRQTETAQIRLIGNANNVGGRGFGGGGGRGGWGFGGGGGLRSGKDIGLNFGTAGDKLETSGSVRYGYNGSDSKSWTSSEDFFNTASPFSNRNSASWGSNNRVNTQFRLEWKPDSMTNVLFRPSASYSRNRGMSSNTSAAFVSDPYELKDEDPLVAIADSLSHKVDYEKLKDILVNSNIQTQQTYSNNKSANGELQLNRKLNNTGRNITLRLTGSIGSSESKQLSAADIKYYKQQFSQPSNNRYYETPGRNRSYSVQATYSEPIAYKTYLQFSYRYNYSYSKSERAAAIYSPTDYVELSNALHQYRYDVAGIVNYLLGKGISMDWDDLQSKNLSQLSEYNTYTHTATLMFRRVRDAYNFSLGVDLIPQRSVLNYEYLGNKFDDVTQNVFNFAPRVELRYKFNNSTNLQLGYNGRTSQPSMTNLLDIVDDSNPMNVTRGNTDLKPSFSHSLHAFYNTFNMDHQAGFFSHIMASLTQNSIDNQTSYDDKGVRYTRPMNINGNWNVNGGIGGNISLDKDNLFYMNYGTDLRFTNSVGFYNEMKAGETDYFNKNNNVKQTTKTLNLSPDLGFGFRNEYWDVSINGSLDYNHSRNNKVDTNNMDTYTFTYGAELDYRTEFGLRFHTDISMNSRRGYSQSSMNTNELLWNAQISKSLLKNNALTLSLEVNDILGQQSNISRTISALSRTDSRTNAIYQYGMLRATYRLNIFGGRKGGRGGMGGFGGGFGGGMPMGGFGGGGFGGGRPPMGF